MGTVLWVAIGLCAVMALYPLHRLCLWLEERGHLFYRHKQPTSSAAGCFVALQQFLEPSTKQIVQVGDEVEPNENEGGDPVGPNKKLSPVAPAEAAPWRFRHSSSRSG